METDVSDKMGDNNQGGVGGGGGGVCGNEQRVMEQERRIICISSTLNCCVSSRSEICSLLYVTDISDGYVSCWTSTHAPPTLTHAMTSARTETIDKYVTITQDDCTGPSSTPFFCHTNNFIKGLYGGIN